MNSIDDVLSYQPGSNRLLEVNATERPNRATQTQQSWSHNQTNYITSIWKMVLSARNTSSTASVRVATRLTQHSSDPLSLIMICGYYNV